MVAGAGFVLEAVVLEAQEVRVTAVNRYPCKQQRVIPKA